MTAPIAVSDYEAKAVAEDLGIGPYAKEFKKMMCRAGAWKLSEEVAKS